MYMGHSVMIPIQQNISIIFSVPTSHRDEKVCVELMDKNFPILYENQLESWTGHGWFRQPPDIEVGCPRPWPDIEDPEVLQIIREASAQEQRKWWEEYWANVPSSTWHMQGLV